MILSARCNKAVQSRVCREVNGKSRTSFLKDGFAGRANSTKVRTNIQPPVFSNLRATFFTGDNQNNKLNNKKTLNFHI